MNPEENLNKNTPENKPKERVPIKSLRTFQGDVQEAISQNNFSTTKIFVAEQEKRLENPEPEVTAGKTKARNNTFALFGSVFILLGVLIMGWFYYAKSNEKVAVEERTKALIGFSEEKKITASNREELLSKFSESRNSWNVVVNSVLYANIDSNSGKVSAENFLDMLAPNMPPSLKRSFGHEYMLGIYSFDTNEPFLILKVADYPLAYSGMLKWEETMLNDVGGLFGSMSEISDKSETFVDESIKNKDLRVLKNSTGNPLILYSFIDRETLVITKNRNILGAVVDKILINSQTR